MCSNASQRIEVISFWNIMINFRQVMYLKWHLFFFVDGWAFAFEGVPLPQPPFLPQPCHDHNSFLDSYDFHIFDNLTECLQCYAHLHISFSSLRSLLSSHDGSLLSSSGVTAACNCSASVSLRSKSEYKSMLQESLVSNWISSFEVSSNKSS